MATSDLKYPKDTAKAKVIMAVNKAFICVRGDNDLDPEGDPWAEIRLQVFAAYPTELELKMRGDFLVTPPVADGNWTYAYLPVASYMPGTPAPNYLVVWRKYVKGGVTYWGTKVNLFQADAGTMMALEDKTDCEAAAYLRQQEALKAAQNMA